MPWRRHRGFRRLRGRQAHQHLACRRIAEIGVFRRGRRFFGAIKRIDDQHRIPGFRQSRRHLHEGGTQTEDIRPDQHARVLTRGGMDEIGIAAAIRGLDRHIAAFRLGCVREPRERGHESGAQCQRAKLPSRNVTRSSREFLQIIVFAHAPLPESVVVEFEMLRLKPPFPQDVFPSFDGCWTTVRWCLNCDSMRYSQPAMRHPCGATA